MNLTVFADSSADEFPDLSIKAVPPAMQMIGTLVAINLELLSVDLEPAIPDPVAITSACGAEIGIGRNVGFDIVETRGRYRQVFRRAPAC